MKQILLYIWQLPQNLLGLLLVWLYEPSRKHILNNGVEIYYTHKIKGGISLGKYVIVHNGHFRLSVSDSLSRNTVRHEAIGHTKQSRILGWLYLPVVGINSALHAALCKCRTHSYYDLWFEKWADKIAGIKR